jgi:hypothetical protein
MQNFPSSIYKPWKKQGSKRDELFEKFVENFGSNAGDILKSIDSRHHPMDMQSPLKKPASIIWEEAWSIQQEHTRDPVGARLVNKLAAEIRKQPDPQFIDPFFPPDSSSLYVDPHRKYQDFLEGHYHDNIVWKRPSELFPGTIPKVPLRMAAESKSQPPLSGLLPRRPRRSTAARR